MTTARDIINSAYRIVITGSEDPTAEEAADALESLNHILVDMCSAEPVGLSDDLPTALRDDVSLRYVLASMMATEYGAALSPRDEMRVSSAESRLSAAYSDIPESVFDVGLRDRTWLHNSDIDT